MLDKKIAWVDLTNRTVKAETIPLEWRRKYLGARGLISFLTWSLTDGKSDPASPEAPLLVGVGWMTGLPSFGGRTFIGGLSPNPSRVGLGTVGGYFGAEMKYAGFDLLVIRGKSETPVYLMITDDNIEILDADYLWGLEVRETQETIRRHHNDPEIRSLVIGPAGEKLVRMANIMTGWKDSGGSGWGSGWLAGSKKLKAIAAKGTGDVKVAYPKEYLSWMKEQQDLLLTRKWIKAMRRYGSPLLLTVSSEGGWVGAGRNIEAVSADKLDPYTVRMAACTGCAVHCRHSHYISEGKYAGTIGEGPEYSGTSGVGVGHRIPDIEAVMALTDHSNRLGIAVLGGGLVSSINTLMEQGRLTEEDVGYNVDWGDADALMRLIDDVANRRTPFGNAVADKEEGLKRLPPAVSDYMGVFKGNMTGRGGMTGVKSFALAQLANAIPGYGHRTQPGLDVLGLPEKFLEELYGGPVSNNYRSYEGKDRMVWWHEMVFTIADCLGTCLFQGTFNCPHAPKWEEFRELIRLTSGLDFSMEELKDVASRITTIEKLTLGQHGWGTRDADRIPATWLDEIKGGTLKGDVLDPAKCEEFLDGFYKLHGWDNNGVPTKELIKRLGIAKAKGL